MEIGDREVLEAEFDGGIGVVYRLGMEEYERHQMAIERAERCVIDPSVSAEERALALGDARPTPPLWMQICGFDPSRLLAVEVAERRDGIKRLLRVVERMYRAEMTARDGINGSGKESSAGVGSVLTARISGLPPGADCSDEIVGVNDLLKKTNVAKSYAERSAFFDPLPEICAYLGIAQRKLSELSRQQTGLRIPEIGDCIRVEGLRARMEERFRAVVRDWYETLSEREQLATEDDFRAAAWRFVKWVRGNGLGESRKKLAWELGVPTAARLGRAVFVVEGETIEEIELEVALALVRMVGLEPTNKKEPGACLSDVLPISEKNPYLDERVPGEREEDEDVA